MAYYGQGDYYGQGGIGSFFKGAVKTIGRAAGGFITGGPAGAVTAALSPLARPQSGGGIQIPPVLIQPKAMLPGGDPFISFGRRPRRRRMQYTNQKALRRANRRVDGFVREVKKSLKHTNYTLVSKSSRAKGKGPRPSVIVETGPGGVRA